MDELTVYLAAQLLTQEIQVNRALGWTPAHKFEDGIREMVRWYLDNQAWVKTVLAKAKA